MSNTQPHTTPPHERVHTLDTLRGFAIFGILIANLLFGFSGYSPELTQALPTDQLDKIIIFLKSSLIEAKFYNIFSFLFGVGFGLQLVRSHADNPHFFQQYRRRLFILFLIGILHALLWRGDILTLYALLGFILILFHDKSPRFILICAFISFCIPIAIDTLRCLIYINTNQSVDIFTKIFGDKKNLEQQFLTINGEGDFISIFLLNLTALKWRWFDIIITSRVFRVFGMFLLGLYTAKQHIFSHVDHQKPLIKKILFYGITIGLLLNLVFAILVAANINQPNFLWLLKMICYTFGAPLLGLGYVAAITLACHKGTQPKLATVLSYVGKMALTNYLLQTVICVLIFYSFGLALYGTVSATACVVLAVVIFTSQIIFSYFWLKYFNYGPAEWVWRSLTYGKWFPLRKSATVKNQD